MFDKTGIYAEFDLVSLNLLPADWDTQIESLSIAESYNVHLDGKSSTSREPSDTLGTDVFIVDGLVVQEKANWLYNLYSTELLLLADITFHKNIVLIII